MSRRRLQLDGEDEEAEEEKGREKKRLRLPVAFPLFSGLPLELQERVLAEALRPLPGERVSQTLGRTGALQTAFGRDLTHVSSFLRDRGGRFRFDLGASCRPTVNGPDLPRERWCQWPTETLLSLFRGTPAALRPMYVIQRLPRHWSSKELDSRQAASRLANEEVEPDVSVIMALGRKFSFFWDAPALSFRCPCVVLHFPQWLWTVDHQNPAHWVVRFDTSNINPLTFRDFFEAANVFYRQPLGSEDLPPSHRHQWTGQPRSLYFYALTVSLKAFLPIDQLPSPEEFLHGDVDDASAQIFKSSVRLFFDGWRDAEGVSHFRYDFSTSFDSPVLLEWGLNGLSAEGSRVSIFRHGKTLARVSIEEAGEIGNATLDTREFTHPSGRLQDPIIQGFVMELNDQVYLFPWTSPHDDFIRLSGSVLFGNRPEVIRALGEPGISVIKEWVRLPKSDPLWRETAASMFVPSARDVVHFVDPQTSTWDFRVWPSDWQDHRIRLLDERADQGLPLYMAFGGLPDDVKIDTIVAVRRQSDDQEDAPESGWILLSSNWATPFD